MNYPVVMSRPGSSVEFNYGGLGAIPTTFIIDRQNNIRQKIVGSRTKSFFEALVRPLIYSNVRANVGWADNALRLSWPVSQANFVIEAADSLANPFWQTVNVTPQVEGTQRVVTLPDDGSSRFFRLKLP